MCRAITEMIEDGRMEGRTEGRMEGICALIELCREFGKTYEETKKKIVEKFGLDEDKAQEFMENYWKID